MATREELDSLKDELQGENDDLRSQILELRQALHQSGSQ